MPMDLMLFSVMYKQQKITALCNLDVHSQSTWPQGLTKTFSAVVLLFFLLLAGR